MTGTMNDVLEQREGSIEEYRKGISLDGAGEWVESYGAVRGSVNL